MQEEEVRLSKEVDELCGQARAVDEAEDEQFGPAQRGDELPEELQHRQSRLSKIRAAKARLEAEQAQADDAKAGIRMTNGDPLAVGGTSNGTMAFRTTRIRVTLPIPKAAS